MSEQLDVRYLCPELLYIINNPIMANVISGNHIFGMNKLKNMGKVSAPSDIAQLSQREKMAFSFDMWWSDIVYQRFLLK